MTDDNKRQMMAEALPGYEPEIGRLIWMLEDTRRRTKEVLGGLSPEALDWTPGATANSIGALLYHLAVIEADWLYVEVLEAESFPPDLVELFPEDVRDESDRLAAARGVSLMANLSRLDVVRGHLLAAYRGMTLAEFRRVRELPGYDVTPEWVLHHLMQHEAEHRGQIGLLRDLAESTADSV
jgi:uncharacterized damage-inducible protein DinB